ncbi:hypothetical protein J4466_02885 [Candidatus Pacearchaeota archaeon]|nr:hypothetical protein [Candidatus Pacearchaeota archaeon]
MEETKFIRYVGDSPVSRILDFLIIGRDFDYSLSDIARNSGVSWTTLYRVWPQLVENKIIIPTRVIGKAKLFRLNSQNEVVRNLVILYKTILKAETNISSRKLKKMERIVA